MDDNQPLLVKQLRRLGVKVHSLSAAGNGVLDLLIGWRGVLMLWEIKDPSKEPARRKLTPKQQVFFDEWKGYPLYIIETLDEALAILRVIDEKELDRLRRVAL